MSKVNYIEYINVKEEDVVLNKLKKMLMKQNPEPILDNQDLEPDQVDGMVEIEPTQEEVDEMNNQADTDPEYLEYSSELPIISISILSSNIYFSFFIIGRLEI